MKPIRPGSEVRVGTAGWTIPRAVSAHLPGEGSHLERYGRTLAGVELNSTFYRPHAIATYAKWANATPAGFRFALKLPKAITHELKLRRARPHVIRFLADSAGLGEKRGPILVQLPPSHAFDRRVASRFFGVVREHYGGPLVCEPRHATWFTPLADRLLAEHHVARVVADPAVVPEGLVPGGWPGLIYLRLHGSPRMYWSSYDTADLDRFAGILQAAPAVERWCMFDNTASGAALANALDLQQRLAGSSPLQLAAHLQNPPPR